ncbi:MAG: histidinol-phosphatase [Planctomycetaceae bacterium]|jgi:histidinol phosphatase-like enzyme (inositol monophosphatase family)|nr:histidinol-phosphatase [Planctomycetaceae bacterium]
MSRQHFPAAECQSRLAFARHLAGQAGSLTLRYFYQTDLAIEQKEDFSPVTAADRETEQFLRQQIAGQFPNDAVFGEEFPRTEGTSGFRWYLDPIDGTKSFIHRVPLYTTLIGLEYGGEITGGIISAPALGELVWAGRGQGAWLESKQNPHPVPCKVSSCTELSEACFVTSEVLTFSKTNRQNAYRNLERSVKLTRTWGDAYGYLLTATGRADIMVDPQMSEWDAGPLPVILEEAGGCFTDWKGNRTIFGKEGVATNGKLHAAVLQKLQAESLP